MEDSGSTTSPIMPSSARASSAMSRSSSSEPAAASTAAQRREDALQQRQRAARAGNATPAQVNTQRNARTSAEPAVKEEARANGRHGVSATLAVRRVDSHATPHQPRTLQLATSRMRNATRLANVETVSAAPEDVQAPVADAARQSSRAARQRAERRAPHARCERRNAPAAVSSTTTVCFSSTWGDARAAATL
jgi:hypothetical protein